MAEPIKVDSHVHLYRSKAEGQADKDGYTIDVKPTICEPGQYIVLRAEMDCFMAFSACPQDVLPIHGEGGAKPRDCHFEILD